MNFCLIAMRRFTTNTLIKRVETLEMKTLERETREIKRSNRVGYTAIGVGIYLLIGVIWR